MAKQKRKLTPAATAAKKRRREETMVVFMNGKQKRVPRPPTIDGLPVDEFILRNADPIWLHQNEMWEYIDEAMDRVLRAARPGDMTRLPSAASGLRRNCRIAARHPNPTRSR